MTEPKDAIDIAHDWQRHRERCVELAISAGAAPQNVISLAADIGKYIVTKSDLEKSVK